MKKSLLILVLQIGALHLSAQPNKKPAAEKAPTQAEMQQMMKELENMSPEEKKMMEQMGIKMPNMKDMPKMGDKNIAEAMAGEGMVIPPKNIKLISTLPKKIFSKAELSSYVKRTNTSVANMIKPGAKEMADKLADQFKNDKYIGALLASAANGMWASGYQEAGVYLMGKAIEALPNADNYNNYAAYLTMLGAGHIAIPILEKLNSVHPKNSTILNNLGHAWLQLGEEAKATNYLDSTVMIYAHHPQANYTKCLILEEKGDKTGAINALNRSLKHSVTKVKVNKLKQLENDKTKSGFSGFRLPKIYHSSSFNLGIYIAMIPQNYALTAGRSIDDEWVDFRKNINLERERVLAALKVVDKRVADELMTLNKKLSNNLRGNPLPPYYYHAIQRLKSYSDVEAKNYGKTYADETAIYIKKWGELKLSFDKELTTAKDKWEREGTNSEILNSCPVKKPIIDRYLHEINGLNRSYHEMMLRFLVTNCYNRYYYETAVALTDAAALKTVLEIKNMFLQKLYEMKHEAYRDPGDCVSSEKQYQPIKKELPDYDEVNCNIMNAVVWPGWGSMVMRCNNMTFTINSILLPVKGSLTAHLDGYVEQASIGVKVKAVDIEVGASFDKNGNFIKGNGSIGTNIKGIDIKLNGEVDQNGFQKGSVDLGIDNELKFLPVGLEGESPVEIGLKNELGVTMEINSEGNTDFIVKDKLSGTVSSNIEIDNKVELTPGMISKGGKVTEPEKFKLPLPSAPSVSIGADSRWSVNSGFSTPTGSLKGLNIRQD